MGTNVQFEWLVGMIDLNKTGGYTMDMITVEYDRKIAIIRLNRSITNPLDLELLQQLEETLDRVRDDREARGLVIASSNNKFFSLGFDIPHLFELDREGFRVFFRTYNRLCMGLFTFPKPTVAALTGHTIAGGCIIALCCDYRIISEGRKLMGLNEIKLGVPIPYPGDCILRQLVGARYARDIVESGEFYHGEELLKMGMADEVVPLDNVVSRAVEKAALLGSMPEKAYRMIKHDRVDLIAAQVEAQIMEKEEAFLDCWFSEGTRALLDEAMKKF